MKNSARIVCILGVALVIGGLVGCSFLRDRWQWAGEAAETETATETESHVPWSAEVPPGYKAVEKAGRDADTGLWKEIVHEKTGVVMILVPGGKYQANWYKHASEWEKNRRKARWMEVTRPYYMGKYEVTNKQYCIYLNETGNKEERGVQWVIYNEDWCGIRCEGGKYYAAEGWEERPVVGVTWYGARSFAKWIGADLPTDTQWEYACRAGSPYYFWYQEEGESYRDAYGRLHDYAWYAPNSKGRPHNVGIKRPNAWGLYDMRGNVWEWCLNYWYEDYTRDYATHDYKYGYYKNDYLMRLYLARGGSWSNTMWAPRGADRAWNIPDWRDANYGFRVCEPDGWTGK